MSTDNGQAAYTFQRVAEVKITTFTVKKSVLRVDTLVGGFPELTEGRGG